MRTHQDWTSPGFDMSPHSAATGPFTGKAMLRAWWELRGEGELVLVEGQDALLPLHAERGTFRFLGEADLFDYHSPLGTEPLRLAAEWAEGLEPGVGLEFDSLPGDSADALLEGLSKAGLAPVAEAHESSAVLALPDEYEGYLAGLDKKQRHEIRRKRRRFVEILGEPHLHRAWGQAAVDQFATMHRRASGEKGTFMTADMEVYFSRLHTDAAGHLDFLYGDDDTPVAAAFGFEDESVYYLYNSAYDPTHAAASPGIVLVNELIGRTIADGRDRFDFLKGDEVYKYRLGAEARTLWRVTATTGAQR